VPPDAPEFDPVSVLKRFADANVDFVVIGGVAGGAHGSIYATEDVDVAYARTRENLERLAALLRELGAELRGAPRDPPFQLDARSLSEGGNFTFDTSLGSVDIRAFPAGAPAYEQLRHDATVIDVEGRRVRVASLDHLIAMKEAAGRPKDLLAASEYRVLTDELNRRGRP
jgi:predicted nucleotidyltransferase